MQDVTTKSLKTAYLGGVFAVAFMLTLASNVFGQPSRDNSTRPVVPTGTGSIHGRIVALDTGKPLSRARIALSAPELGPDGRLTSTNGDGRYEINDLPAARYTLAVSRNGYLPLRFGQRRPLEQAIPLELDSNQQLDRVDFALPPAGAISGRITDENGEPVVGTNVWVMRSAYLDGRRQWIRAVNGLPTDDAGEYRISGLSPGTYRVLAWLRESWMRDDDGQSVRMAYAPTYFPGTTSASDAQAVTVKLGQDVINTDFSLTAGRAASISGTAIDSRGRPLQGVTLVGQVGDIESGFGSALVNGDGAFTLRSVAPGHYTLIAATSPNAERPEGANAPVEIDGVDLDGVTLTAAPGWSLSGSVRSSDGRLPPFPHSRLTVSARMLTGLRGMMIVGSPEYHQDLNNDWTFTVSGLVGPARLRIVLPPGWFVQKARYDGWDIADAPVTGPSGGSISDVQVIVSDRVASVTGQLMNDTGAPVADGTVVLFAADSAKWFETSRHVRTTRPDQYGRYEIKDVPPGDYFIAGIDYLEDGALNDPDVVRALVPYAQKIALAEGVQTRSLTVVAITR